jgi:spermidine synthase
MHQFNQANTAILDQGSADAPDPQPADFLLPFRTVEMVKTCEGKDMVLQEKEGDYFLYLDGEMLMGGKCHRSEDALGTLGCRALDDLESPRILIGGLGMGFTLRAVLEEVGPVADIVTAELSEDVIRWNQPEGPLAEAAGCPVADPRSSIALQDLGELIRASDPGSFDAILIDTDNEPHALSYGGNDSLYTKAGLREIRRAIRKGGVLSFWFLRAPLEFDDALQDAGFISHRHEVPCEEGGLHLIIVATAT